MAVEGHSPLIIGRYEVHGEIASGGMATVHFGRLIGPSGFSRTVAIKRLHDAYAKDPELASRFLEEARLSARIRHPNVVPTLDVIDTDDGRLFLVMDYVEGESLSRLLKAAIARAERIPLGIGVGILTGALRGLHAAHETRDERGEPLEIVHRDVSPQNILVGVDGGARVLDFGIAKALGRVQTTRQGQLKGKLSYMAPEQLQGGRVDRRTDVFAASIVLWEVLCCRPLFHAETEAETVGNLLTRTVDPPSKHVPGVSSELDAVVMRGLSRAPVDRYPTALDMALALEAIVPLVPAAQTGQWVSSMVEELLATRAKRIAEIESRAGSDRSGPQRASAPPSASSSGSLALADRATSIVPRSGGPPRTSSGPTASVPVAAAIASLLATYLGPHTSRVAVKTFAMKALGRGPETLTRDDVPVLLNALRPMLRTFVGRAHCELLLERIAWELGT